MRVTWKGAIATLFAVASTAAFADTAYDNFGVNHEHRQGGGTVMPGNDVGAQFVSLATGSISSIDLALVSGPGGATPFEISLWTDSNNTVGSLIKSWSLTVSNPGSANGFVTVQNSDPLAGVTAGQTYWLIASSTTQGAWFGSLTDTGRTLWGSSANYNYVNAEKGAFAIFTGEPVPEPATLGIVACGALAMLRRRKRS